MCYRLPKVATSHHYRLKRISPAFRQFSWITATAFIRAGSIELDGLPTVGAPRLIALKARAWLDLTDREKRGEKIDSKTIKKHKNDVFRLFQILDPADDPAAPEAVKRDIREFITRMRDEDVDLKSLGLRTGTRDGILAEIARAYRLAESE